MNRCNGCGRQIPDRDKTQFYVYLYYIKVAVKKQHDFKARLCPICTRHLGFLLRWLDYRREACEPGAALVNVLDDWARDIGTVPITD